MNMFRKVFCIFFTQALTEMALKKQHCVVLCELCALHTQTQFSSLLIRPTKKEKEVVPSDLDRLGE